nr:PREDICTED: arf-GAP with Rho-GAP domain, ANK repeat and PH domain-containing protein 3 isoform X2 [Latimeria chalumnae]|eukprot:XP_005995408.1 PREDICTED: arf-GAP with Rho-GAP domain, ANK repeat and PH domain-containing protein 3 isoform X2 [Latimeria chalumnae]
MAALYDEDSDIGKWLASIHLEKYLESFQQHGFFKAKDATRLDNEALLQIGITATGYRKRILKLVELTRLMLEPQDELVMENPLPESDAAPGAPGTFSNSHKDTTANASVQNADSLCSEALSSTEAMEKEQQTNPSMKPVPKPRTVFNKTTTAPKPILQSVPVPELVPAPRSTPESFVILEGFTPGESNTDPDVLEFGIDPHFELEEEKLDSFDSPEPVCKMDDSCEALPPLPPRMKRGIPPSCFSSQSHPLRTEAEGAVTTPLSSSPTSSGSTQEVMSLTPPSQLSSLSSHPMQLEMIANELYAGARVTPQQKTRSLDAMKNRPVPQLPVLAKQNWGYSTEKKNSLSKSVGDLSTFTDRGDRSSVLFREEPISPYCESLFSKIPSNQEQKVAVAKSCQGKLNSSQSFSSKEEDQSKEEDSGVSSEYDVDTPRRGCKDAHYLSQSYSTVKELQDHAGHFSLPSHLYPDEILEDMTISPYASFSSPLEGVKPVLSSWLDKLSPQGNYVFQRRFVKFDGKNLMYFSNEKEVYAKGVIPLGVIEMARTGKDNKFEIVTSQRAFVFRAESEALRNEWCKTVQSKVMEYRLVSHRPRLSFLSQCRKSGYLELKGQKSRIYVAITADQVWIYKNEQSFRNGIGITLIDVNGSTIRDAKGRSFELITLHKTFSFIADSEREKKEWIEAFQESLSEMLSDYEVAEKIWSNVANKSCADCKVANPDWASINLCVVICKKCAGQHRGLGTSISKVQSLKLDISIWSNEIVQLFLMLGNDRANWFWAAQLTLAEALCPDASVEQRRDFITQKYRDGKFRRPHPRLATQEEILKALSAAFSGPNLLKTVIQVFSEAEVASGAEVNDYDLSLLPSQNSNPKGMSDTYSYRTSEIRNSGLFDTDRLYDEIMQPVVHCGYLYKTSAISKQMTAKKTKDEFQKRWCSLQRSLLFYETDKSPQPIGKLELGDIVCLGVNRCEPLANPGLMERFRYTFEVFLSSEKLYQFGMENPETLQAWSSALGKAFTPVSCHCLLGREFERVGRLRYKAMLNPDCWNEGFFVLRKSNLFICPGSDAGGEAAAEDSVNLKRLQELTVTSQMENNEKKEVLVLVENGRTLYLHGLTRLDFSMWCSDIQAAAGGKGNALCDQQLSRNDIPIIVDSCIAFITQYGLRHEGIYRKNGSKSRIKLLMDEFRKDARNVKLRISENYIEDVTDVLKRFFREIDDPVFMSELHPLWKEAAEISQKPKRLDRYKELIRSLPKVNRATLAALIGHLYRVQKCADLNQMCTKNLSLLFAPSSFQTDGKGEHEVKIMEDLIDNYIHVFDIDEDQVNQMDLEVSLITSWKDVQLSQAGDLIIEVYLEKKLPDNCVTLKVSPMMSAGELTNQVLDMWNLGTNSKEVWLTFEVIENGELERPLHPKEKVLEQALQWCKLPVPSSAHFLVKKGPQTDGVNPFSGHKNEIPKSGMLKCREEPPKLLGCKFQERYFMIRDHKLLLLKDKKSTKAEREWSLSSMKVYLGVRKKVKAPTQWGFTLFVEKQQLYLSVAEQTEMWDWIASILCNQHDDLQTVVLRRHSSSDFCKQNFGTMPLVPIRGDETNSSMLSANQTLPMKMHQDSLDEQNESDDITVPEPLYEEVGNFDLHALETLQTSFLTDFGKASSPDRSEDRCLSKTLPLEKGPWSDRASPFEKNTIPNPAKTAPAERAFRAEPTMMFPSEKQPGLESRKPVAPERTRGAGLQRTAPLEKVLEHTSSPMPLERGLGLQSTVNSDLNRPLPVEPLSPLETVKVPPRKKSTQLSSPTQERLLQELTTALMKKTESPAATPQTDHTVF